MMGANVLEQSRLHGVRKLVVCGTVCAYPKHTPVPFREDDLWNGYPEETNAPYGVAKKSLLVGAQAYREQYGLDAIFLLPANLYGPRDNFDLDDVARDPGADPEDGRGDGEVVLWGDGSPTREFLYVEDCAEGLVLAAERYDGAEPVNLGTGVETSIRELAETGRRVDRASRARSAGTRRCRTASRGGRSTRRGRESCSASGRGRRSARASSGPSPGTASHASASSRSSRLSTELFGRSALRLRLASGARAVVRSPAVTPRLLARSSSCSRSSARHNGWLFYQGGDQIWY